MMVTFLTKRFYCKLIEMNPNAPRIEYKIASLSLSCPIPVEPFD